jgi:hypothetical protein
LGYINKSITEAQEGNEVSQSGSESVPRADNKMGKFKYESQEINLAKDESEESHGSNPETVRQLTRG